VNHARPTRPRPGTRQRSHTQQELLMVLHAHGPMETHALQWKAAIASDRRFWGALEKLVQRGDVVQRPGTDVVQLAPKTARSS